MGVRYGISTYAFLAAKPETLVSYDYTDCPNLSTFIKLADENGINYTFNKADTRDLEIEETDFLFIDTLHHYDQLKVELELHGNKARKYLGFHDTTSYEFIGEKYTIFNDWFEEGKGLWRAIEEFLESNPHWEIAERFTNNNGLTILKRK